MKKDYTVEHFSQKKSFYCFKHIPYFLKEKYELFDALNTCLNCSNIQILFDFLHVLCVPIFVLHVRLISYQN